MSELEIQFVEADEVLKCQVMSEWGEKATRHVHIGNGFSILAMQGNDIIGLISIYWKVLPALLPETREGYIDILEVRKDLRRRGIARKLIELSMKQARENHSYQVRAWSSLDKVEAIPMWRALGFGLCPASTYPNGQEVKGYFATRPLPD